MADRQIAKGIICNYDVNGDLTVDDTIGEIRNLTPPPKSADTVDVTIVGDEVEQLYPAETDNAGEYTFEQIWHISDTNHELLDTAFNTRDTTKLYLWNIIFPFTTPKTQQFSGWVKSLTPSQVDAKGVFSRTCVIQLTSAITIL